MQNKNTKGHLLHVYVPDTLQATLRLNTERAESSHSRARQPGVES